VKLFRTSQGFLRRGIRILCIAAIPAMKLVVATSKRSRELIENNNIKINTCIVQLINFYENEVNIEKAVL
jgi:hypothetical protein